MSTVNKRRLGPLGLGSAVAALAALAVLATTASAKPAAHRQSAASNVSLALILDDLTNPVELPLRKGFTHGTSTYATKANLAKVRQSPDVKYAG